MLSLAWLTVFIIFVYVPGSTLNSIERSSSPSVLLSGSNPEAKSETPLALVASSLVRGDEFANEKQFLRTNIPSTTTSITTTSTAASAPKTTRELQPTLVPADNAHSIVTKDPSTSPSSSSLSSSLLKIQLTQVTTPSTATTTATSTTTQETAPRVWSFLNDIGDRNSNGRSSVYDYGHPPTSQKQIQQQQQQTQLALFATHSTSGTNTTPLPVQLTETLQNTARVIIRGKSVDWGYVGLVPSESTYFASRTPLSGGPPETTSSASIVLSVSSSSLSPPTTSTTVASTSSTTTTVSPSLDGYLNITSQAGTHAYLPCNVKQLVKKPISWLRVRDGHILTVDQTTFIADQRFQSIYTPNPERWSLQIKYVQTKDAGTYECQVSTEPKTSAIVSLNIVEPKTELIGESNRHVKAGSQVKLRCIISQALEPPLFINWYHNRKQIYLHNRKGWRTEIERDAAGNVTTDKQITIASLIIPSVSKKDSGNYTCSPSNSEPITVVLHVLNGEYSASAITSGSSRSNSSKDTYQQQLHTTLLWVISFLMCFGQLRHHHSRFLPQGVK